MNGSNPWGSICEFALADTLGCAAANDPKYAEDQLDDLRAELADTKARSGSEPSDRQAGSLRVCEAALEICGKPLLPSVVNMDRFVSPAILRGTAHTERNLRIVVRAIVRAVSTYDRGYVKQLRDALGPAPSNRLLGFMDEYELGVIDAYAALLDQFIAYQLPVYEPDSLELAVLVGLNQLGKVSMERLDESLGGVGVTDTLLEGLNELHLVAIFDHYDPPRPATYQIDPYGRLVLERATLAVAA